MKKLLSLLMACTLMLSLPACGQSASSPAPSLPQVQPAPSQAASEPAVSSSEATRESSDIPVPSSEAQPSSEAVPGALDESESTPSSEDTPASSAAEASEAQQSSTTGPMEEETGKSLVVYFSWSGNTESVAAEIQRQTGADSFELAPATPYTDDYNALLDLAQDEQRSNARPAISGSVDLSGYDTIYLGYPNWWGDMPMIVYTFLESYDLAGKTVAPFCTSGGSGLSGSVGAIRSAQPGATVLDGLHIGSGSASNPAGAVSQWLAGHAQ